MTRNQKIVLISTVAVVASLPAVALVRAATKLTAAEVEKIKDITNKFGTNPDQ